MNESKIIAWLKTYVYAAPEVQLEMIREMAQRFGRLQARITGLEGELKQMLTATLTSAQAYEEILLGKNERITELEAQVRNLRRQREIDEAYTEEVDNSMSELLEDHEEEVSRLNARIAELEAQKELVQVDEDEDLHDPINVGGEIHTMYSGTAFILVGYETEADCIHLPPGYCIAKVQP